MRRVFVALILIMLIPSSVFGASTIGDFEYSGTNYPSTFANVYDSQALVEVDLDVLFFAQVTDVDNSSGDLTVILYYSNDSFLVQNISQPMSYSELTAPDTYEYTYLFDGQSAGVYYQYYYTVNDGFTTVRSPSQEDVFYDIQWGIIVGDTPSSDGGGSGSGFSLTGNVRLDIHVLYQFSDVGNARIDITIYEDFYKQIKLASFQTYSDSSGSAMTYVQADEGDWIEVHVTADWKGDIKEAEIQKHVNNVDDVISITINLYDGFFGIDNSITREFIKTFFSIVGLLIFVVIAYAYYRRSYKKTGLLRDVVVFGRKNELFGHKTTPRWTRKHTKNKL